jgi:hypothetical protein
MAPAKFESGPTAFQVEFIEELASTTEYIYNAYSKSVVSSILVTGFIAQAAAALNFQCFNIGTGFIKFFQILEILGKFFYVPVQFNDELENVLYSIN